MFLYHPDLLYSTIFSSFVLPWKRENLIYTANVVTGLVHVARTCVFVVVAARFCSHSTVCVYVDVIHYLQTSEPIPCATVCIWAASRNRMSKYLRFASWWFQTNVQIVWHLSTSKDLSIHLQKQCWQKRGKFHCEQHSMDALHFNIN